MFHMPSLENRDGGYRSFMVPTLTLMGPHVHVLISYLHPSRSFHLQVPFSLLPPPALDRTRATSESTAALASGEREPYLLLTL